MWGQWGGGADGCCMPRVERETAARISEEIGNLMKEIETLVEEKAKESAEMSKFIREGGEGQEGRWDGALCDPCCQLTVPPHMGGSRSRWWDHSFPQPPQSWWHLSPRPSVLFVPQVALWCTKEPVSP